MQLSSGLVLSTHRTYDFLIKPGHEKEVEKLLNNMGINTGFAIFDGRFPTLSYLQLSQKWHISESWQNSLGNLDLQFEVLPLPLGLGYKDEIYVREIKTGLGSPLKECISHVQFAPDTDCNHEWIITQGFSSIYTDCKHCGAKK